MKRNGFTLIEIMISVTILTVVLGILFTLATNLGRSARIQEAKVTTVDEVRTAMMFVTREIRQASMGSISSGTLPGPALTYRVAIDADGNGSAVDVAGNLELSGTRTLARDVNDLNGDGQTVTQLIMVEGTDVRVIANNLLPDEDLNGNDTLESGEDANGNGLLERGLWFESAGAGIRVTIQAQRRADERGFLLPSGVIETVMPRN
ncbi:MAG: prepilin-type N-terminal cleavage/methylation domain-containing protein [Candidatus Hydrogenedentes bacterium]|nr:prepilin-type N-terminal cleavage/methylation domain-containing protein [Candidatus Hydrogenedentota bacterium]